MNAAGHERWKHVPVKGQNSFESISHSSDERCFLTPFPFRMCTRMRSYPTSDAVGQQSEYTS